MNSNSRYTFYKPLTNIKVKRVEGRTLDIPLDYMKT